MERLEKPAEIDVLRDANQGLRAFLARSAGDVQGSEDDVGAMLEVERILRAVGRELDRLRCCDRDDVRVELELYRDNLVRLRQQLGFLQKSATECQARLFIREKHLRAAQQWCAASHSTD
jgi:hypothetical protein